MVSYKLLVSRLSLKLQRFFELLKVSLILCFGHIKKNLTIVNKLSQPSASQGHFKLVEDAFEKLNLTMILNTFKAKK